jgi:TolB protein
VFAAFLGLFTSALGGEAAPSSRPPGRIVYSDTIGAGQKALFVSRADGSHRTRITAGPNDFSPKWSPSGRQIAFVRSPAHDVTGIWIANADGTAARPLDEAHTFAEHPRWSPNGRWIAYQVQTSYEGESGYGLRAHTTFELWLVRPDGSHRHRLMRGPGGVSIKENPVYSVAAGVWAWSPDSRRLAVVAGGEGSERARVIDVRTGRIHGRGRASDLGWSPGGRRLAVVVDTGFEIGGAGCGPVWLVPRDSGKRRQLTHPRNDACDLWPRWSSDGRSIVFTQSPDRPDVLRFVTADGTHSGRIVALGLTRYRWPATCGGLFEYASGEESGWIVHPSPRAAPRFIRFPVGGRTRCDTYSVDPCELAGDWLCK